MFAREIYKQLNILDVCIEKEDKMFLNGSPCNGHDTSQDWGNHETFLCSLMACKWKSFLYNSPPPLSLSLSLSRFKI